ncbi:hypothetical protein [Rothia nasimurium]|uniref:hypothetical protein n=1 Tax=Rothia nasimurium TaxID=85336 RepID=UPI002DD61AE8|nr:hypothetical protein [Rothia nasimurium]
MKELTLKEIAEFRILSSTYNTEKENKLPKKIKDLIKSKEPDYVNKKLIDEIFRKLKFPHGGAIWVKAKFIIEPTHLTIKIEEHKLTSYNLDKEVNLRISDKEFTHPLKIDAHLHKRGIRTQDLEFSTATPGPLTNFSYKRNGKNKFTTNPTNFEKVSKIFGRFIDSEKYYKNVKGLNLPITHDLNTLDKIYEEYSSDPLKNPAHINYIHLSKLAEYISINKLYQKSNEKQKIRYIFDIYKEGTDFTLDTSNENIRNAFTPYKSHYRKISEYTKDGLLPHFKKILETITVENLSEYSKKVSASTPVVFGLTTLLASLFLLQITNWNINYAADLSKYLTRDIFFNIILFTIIGIFIYSSILAGFLFFGTPINLLLDKLHELNIPTIWKKVIILLILMGVISMGIYIKLHFPPLLALMVLIIIIAPISLNVFTRLIYQYKDLFHIPFKVIIFVIAITIPLNGIINFSSPQSLYAQSCAYKIENDRIYAYRYFETNNWAEKIEIAILPGSSDRWIDDSKLQIPTKITVDKSELRSLDSCTDEHSTWSEAEYAFEIEKISSSPKLRRMFPDQETSNLVSTKN